LPPIVVCFPRKNTDIEINVLNYKVPDKKTAAIGNLQEIIRREQTLDRQMESTLAVYEECCEGQES